MSDYAEGSHWYYAPNKVAPIVFIVILCLASSAHVYYTVTYRCWRMMGLMHWANIIFIAGFAMREVGAFHYDNLGVSIASNVLLYAAPPIYASVNYVILGRVLYYIPHLSPIHPGRVITTFLGLGVVIEALTANGAILLADTSRSPRSVRLGGNLIKVSLLLQINIELCFVSILAVFHARSIKKNLFTPRIRRVVNMLYTSSALLIVRNAYRVAETFEALSEDHLGPTIEHEVFFWIFEASLMAINVVLLLNWHPAKYLPGCYKTYLSRDGQTERLGPGWVDKRNVFVTLMDPFDFIGLLRRDDGETPFWDKEQDHEIVSTEGAGPAPKHRYPVMAGAFV
ncbi:MAG: hypothetical protein M1817_005226 [Caeruleum heppii]|nr:MAG: hypothetical protein M1817_005226 [Caeruleum heppii]